MTKKSCPLEEIACCSARGILQLFSHCQRRSYRVRLVDAAGSTPSRKKAFPEPELVNTATGLRISLPPEREIPHMVQLRRLPKPGRVPVQNRPQTGCYAGQRCHSKVVKVSAMDQFFKLLTGRCSDTMTDPVVCGDRARTTREQAPAAKVSI